MRVFDMVQEALDGASVARVFGEPIERDGVTVIPVAMVGAGGGGGGSTGDGPGGSGGGAGVGARPLGVIEITAAGSRFRPIVHPAEVARIVAWLALAVALLRRRRR